MSIERRWSQSIVVGNVYRYMPSSAYCAAAMLSIVMTSAISASISSSTAIGECITSSRDHTIIDQALILDIRYNTLATWERYQWYIIFHGIFALLNMAVIYIFTSYIYMYLYIYVYRFPFLGNWKKCFQPHYYLPGTYYCSSSRLELMNFIPGTWYYI